MKCWKCHKDLEELEQAFLPFRAVCDHCSAWLHCCINCEYYHPGLPNDCKISGTDPIADREASNFCEDFSIKTSKKKVTEEIESVEERLFGEKKMKKKSSFDDLFND